MKYIATIILCLLPYSVSAQVYWESTVADSLLIYNDDVLTMSAISSGFVQPNKEYVIVHTDSTVKLIEKDCYNRWLDGDSVSHCGHEIIKSTKVDTMYQAGSDSVGVIYKHEGRPADYVPRFIYYYYWCVTCKDGFGLREEVKPTVAK